MLVTGHCVRCKAPFSFDPERVPSIPIDPENGLPPDLGGDPSRAVREPVCPSCCKAVNPERRRRGQPLWSEEDTAQTLIHRTR